MNLSTGEDQSLARGYSTDADRMMTAASPLSQRDTPYMPGTEHMINKFLGARPVSGPHGTCFLVAWAAAMWAAALAWTR